MAKIKLTKNEFKKQRDNLKRFQRYLPTLVLKKQQLQMELRKIRDSLEVTEREYGKLVNNMDSWVSVLGEEVGLEEKVVVKDVVVDQINIAGVDIPIFKEVIFDSTTYDFYLVPLWVDTAVSVLKEIFSKKKEMDVLKEQYKLLSEELTVTTQRVNLFEKVKIPETRKNIKVIQIYMGDQQTAAVVRGKISKKKLVAKAE